MKIIEGGVTAAKGFEAAATAAGIKYQGRTDMAIIYSEKPCKVAGTFTTNVVKAAPVKWDRQIVESKQKSQAVIVNSGIANACTGEEGMKYCEETAKEAGKVLGIDEKGVLVGSTGVIGMQIPIDKIKAGITELAKEKKADLASGTEAAKAIMTTDTKKKEVAVTFMAGDTEVTIGGMAKGSGMIHPNMCTMLAFITTDAKISKKALQAAMSSDVEDTYNMISVDGDTSTSCTRLLFTRPRTISAISIVSASVTRSPLINSASFPTFPTHLLISLPPPCTMIGLNPHSFRSVTSSITLRFRLSSTMALPPYFTTMILRLKRWI